MGAAALGREANTRQRVRRREAGPVAGVGARLRAGEGGQERGTAELELASARRRWGHRGGREEAAPLEERKVRGAVEARTAG